MPPLIQRNALRTATGIGLSEAPVVTLLGARQVGKTTLARQIVSSWNGPSTVFDLEEPEIREAFAMAPAAQLRQSEGLAVIDEVQRLPQLFELLRPICDSPERKAQFLLLGSASWDLIKGVSETLAGRVQFVNVPGMSIADVGSRNVERLWMRGGFPRAFLARSKPEWGRWMRSFARTFVERDIPALGFRVSSEALARFWRMLAHCHGQTWNASSLGMAMDASASKMKHYRDLLAGSFMIRVLRPWFEDLGKRLVKSPKVFLRDSGHLHHLLGLKEMNDLRAHPCYASSWEGFALEQTLIAHGDHDSYFYRTQRGAELDLLLLRNGQRWGFEFKCTDAPRTTKSMHVVTEDLSLEHLWVVYPGERQYTLADKITALPIKSVHRLSAFQ